MKRTLLAVVAPPRLVTRLEAPGFHPFVGELASDGDLLVFSTWNEKVDFQATPTRFWTTDQIVQRVGREGCPCPQLSSSPGPLIPGDVNGGRVVAFGEKATLLLDRDGNVLVSLPVAPVAAQLWGNDLVLLFRGALRVYDARDGTLLKTWLLPDVPSSRGCWIRCYGDRLVLEDTARGVAAYVLDGEIHLMRLSDGLDKTLAKGVTARFMDDGLVYAAGSRLRVVPWSSLPLN